MSYNQARILNNLTYEINNREELTFINSNNEHELPNNMIKLYSKDNNNLYTLNDAGVESVIGSGGSAGGDVYGPSSSIDNSVAFFDGTSGKLIQ